MACLIPIALTGFPAFLPALMVPKPAHAEAGEEPAQPQDQEPPPREKGRKGPPPNSTEAHHKPTKEEQYKVHLDLGRFLESQENYELALGEYQQALEACEKRAPFLSGTKSSEKQAVAHRRLGAVLDRLGRFDQSEIQFRTALKIHPNDAKVWNDAGYSYYLQGRWADAERALKTAASLEPTNSRVQTNLGLTLAASGKTDEALTAFSKAGGPTVGHTNLAYILAAMGRDELAMKHYRTALEYQPEYAPAREALAAVEAKVAHANAIAAKSKPPATLAAPALVGASPRLPIPIPPAANPARGVAGLPAVAGATDRGLVRTSSAPTTAMTAPPVIPMPARVAAPPASRGTAAPVMPPLPTSTTPSSVAPRPMPAAPMATTPPASKAAATTVTTKGPGPGKSTGKTDPEVTRTSSGFLKRFTSKGSATPP